MKKILLTLGTIAIVATPIAAVVACGSSNNEKETYRGKLQKNRDLRILTLGDSVAHGDYTFQMSGSGTEYMPMIDGPARVASYQDYIIDELQRDGLMDENSRPDYKTSASGIRTDELANWLKLNNFQEAMKVSNPIEGVSKDVKLANQERINSHLHPYTFGSEAKSVYPYGYKGQESNPAKEIQFDKKTQVDQISMSDHIKNSDVILITIGGNDVLKNLKIFGIPYPSLSVEKIKQKLPEMLLQILSDPSFPSTPTINKIKSFLANPFFLANALGIFNDIKQGVTDLTKGSIDFKAILLRIANSFDGLFKSIEDITTEDKVKLEQWFLGNGHKLFINVDEENQKQTMENFIKNIGTITNTIKKENPNANIIFTGYPSPLLHFPKILRNLAMPIYGQIGSKTEEFANKTKGVYYAPSSLQNWETDDPKDIYKNIIVDPHPTLEGQGVMARDILKVIDSIYHFNAKITDDEINEHTTEIIEAHKLPYKKLEENQLEKEMKDGTFTHPYVNDGKYHEDIDYAYNVKRLPLEEIEHFKVYFPSRIISFLVDAFTDTIKLNSNVENPKDQSVLVDNPEELSLSDFTKKWGDNYLKYVSTKEHEDEPFTKPLSDNFSGEFKTKFEDSIHKFMDSFEEKINEDIESGAILKDFLGKLDGTLKGVLNK